MDVDENRVFSVTTAKLIGDTNDFREGVQDLHRGVNLGQSRGRDRRPRVLTTSTRRPVLNAPELILIRVLRSDRNLDSTGSTRQPSTLNMS